MSLSPQCPETSALKFQLRCHFLCEVSCTLMRNSSLLSSGLPQPSAPTLFPLGFRGQHLCVPPSMRAGRPHLVFPAPDAVPAPGSCQERGEGTEGSGGLLPRHLMLRNCWRGHRPATLTPCLPAFLPAHGQLCPRSCLRLAPLLPVNVL